MADPATTVSWLAAFALGLAYAQRTDEECRAELVTAAGDTPHLLVEAHARLRQLTGLEPPVRDAALRLLAEAAAGLPATA